MYLFGGSQEVQVYRTPLKTDTEPKNDGVEDEFPFQRDDLQVPS